MLKKPIDGRVRQRPKTNISSERRVVVRDKAAPNHTNANTPRSKPYDLRLAQRKWEREIGFERPLEGRSGQTR
jgi:hypothetical protein